MEFQTVLERNPAADLLSLFTDQYQREHRLAQSATLSKVGKINSKTLDELHIEFTLDPEIDLLSVFPTDYNRRMAFAIGPTTTQRTEDEACSSLTPDFRTKLDDANTANVIFPLSEKVQSLLTHCAGHLGAGVQTYSLLDTVKHLLWSSPKLWESYSRGVVVKCSNDIVAKVIMKTEDYTEHTTMEYLMEKAPDIPAPRSHGLIALGHFQVVFMSYIPGVTLDKAWPSLSMNQKSCVRQQLDDIFSRLRTLRMDHGQTLGGVGGEGVKELRLDECAMYKGITTPAQYSDLQFSIKHYGSKSYIKFLHSFVDHNGASPLGKPVFTHGDVRPANIMVDWKPDTDQISVNAIIDWEDSGFYPDYYECTAMTRTLSVVDEDDWYLYLPNSISPSRFPQRWLVDRL